MKILLVDDSKTMRTIHKAVLARLGHTQIEEACDGLAALERVGSFKPDLCLIDWNLPRLNGLGFVKALREFDRTTPLIMVTAESHKARVIEAIKAGVNSYIVKPFTADLLAQRIAETFTPRAAIAHTGEQDAPTLG